jgi:hypothetical protein
VLEGHGSAVTSVSATPDGRPALEVGFQQIDMAGVGPRVPAGQ